jgi:VIT1/CCC1 family predicted Fe2+/Mn2+ transporter
MLFMRRSASAPASLIAGSLLLGYIGVEVLTLNQNPPGPTGIEQFYLGVGVLIVAAAILSWRSAPPLEE